MTLGDALVNGEVLDLHQLTGKGRGDGEVGALLHQVGHILSQVLQLFLCAGDLVLSGLAEDGVEGIAGHDGLTGGDEDLLHRAALGQGDGGGLLGPGGAAARDLGLDGADIGGLGEDLTHLLAAVVQKSVKEDAAHGQSGQDDEQDNGIANFLPAALTLHRLFRGRGSGGGGGLGHGGVGFSHDEFLLTGLMVVPIISPFFGEDSYRRVTNY